MARTMIIGYQDTPQGDDALALGELLAGALDLGSESAGPIVATVLPWSRQLLDEANLEAALRLETSDSFAAVRDRLRLLEPETRAIAHHSPAAALYELAAEEGAELIVVGSTHRGPVGRVLPGDVGTALLHGAPCAVAVAPSGYRDAEQRLRRIGIAFDGSDEGWAALETAVGLSARLHAALTVITVAEPERYAYAAAGSILTAAALPNLEREARQKDLDRALEHIPDAVPVEARLLTGRPGPLLAEATEELDLLVTGSRAYGAVGRTALGSVSAHLITKASCPVLVVPRGAGPDPLHLEARQQGDLVKASPDQHSEE